MCIFFYKSKNSKPAHLVLSVSFLNFVKTRLPFFTDNEDKIAKYWDSNSRAELLEKADRLFEEEKYIEVYETLNRIKYSKDIEIIWRTARALYNLSLTPDISNDVRKEMIGEAQNILESSYTIGQNKSNYHKWLAVISNTKNGLDSLETKVREYPVVRDNLIKACECNPNDFSVQYMLGRWHFEMANMTWFQRKIAKYLYLEPPTSSFQEAYQHLNKAEDLHPRCFIPNLYTLGNVCMKLGQYYRAKYYLSTALNLPPRNECEKCCISGVKTLLTKLEKYELRKDFLYENMMKFGFED